MKKEDLKKLLKEENTGFKPETGKIKTLIFLFVLTCDIFPQIPINGFCKYQSFNIEPGCNNFISLNYNDDSYTDLLFFNPSDKKMFSLDGNRNGTFGENHSGRFAQEISGIQYLWNKNQNIYAYAYISRKQSAAGILKISNTGQPEIQQQIKFNTYPENLSTADINGDGIPELLVSGSAFDGLSIVYQEQKLREKKIVEKTSYSEAVLTDLNNDGYPDIAAFEMFSNKLQFYYNNSQGNFNKVREISFNKSINSLQAADINLDSYSDLILTFNKSITIYYGDFSSSYNDTLIINTKYKVDKLITGDFNRDGKIDIAYINKDTGNLSLIFAKDEKTFYPELIYVKKDSLSDVIPFYSKFVNGIALLADKKLFLISNLSSISDEVSIVSGAYPTAVSYFDKENNSINDICFIDGDNQTFNMLIRSNAGIPETWFAIPLFATESSIIVDDKNPYLKSFYCFTRDKKLIEALKIDLKNNKFIRNSFYATGKIKDVKFKRDNDKLYVAFIKDGTLSTTIISNSEGRYNNSGIDDIKKNVIDAALSVYEKPEVFYASSENDSIVIGEKLLESRKRSETKIGFKNEFGIYLFAGNYLHSNNSVLLGFMNSDSDKNLIFALSPDAFTVTGKNDGNPGFRIKDKNQLFFGELRFNGPINICFYNPDQQTIKSIDLVNGGRKISRNILSNNINARAFFIKNMNSRSYHIVYIDDIENCITIKELQ